MHPKQLFKRSTVPFTISVALLRSEQDFGELVVKSSMVSRTDPRHHLLDDLAKIIGLRLMAIIFGRSLFAVFATNALCQDVDAEHRRCSTCTMSAKALYLRSSRAKRLLRAYRPRLRSPT